METEFKPFYRNWVSGQPNEERTISIKKTSSVFVTQDQLTIPSLWLPFTRFPVF